MGGSNHIERVIVSRGEFHDSVALMLVSRDAEAVPGVVAAVAAMATPLNLEQLARLGFAPPGEEVGPNDLVVAVRAEHEAGLAGALAAIESRLRVEPRAEVAPAPRSLRVAVRRRPSLNLAFVSVPGRHAAVEAAAALEAGLDVFCFSQGPTLAEEALLKRRALERGLLFLGPDAGTAIVDGVGLGFANVVRRGHVGIVGASGTGIQEVCSLLDAAGIGISHAIGVGGRDLEPEVGGLMTRRALELLDADPATEVVVVVAKSGSTGGLEGSIGKPIVVAPTLEEAAARVGGALPPELDERPAATRGEVRGLFSGGTLAAEARAVAPAGTHVDLGDEAFTDGRPHPIVDGRLRIERLLAEAADPAVGVILLDLVLGRGAHPDPAAELAPAVVEARRRGGLSVVVALCGTAGDPQGLERQAAMLREAGAIAVRGTARAARLAAGAAR